jgi:hypothetical protein
MYIKLTAVFEPEEGVVKFIWNVNFMILSQLYTQKTTMNIERYCGVVFEVRVEFFNVFGPVSTSKG